MAKIMPPAQSLANYQTHNFISCLVHETTGDCDVFCSVCGCEDRGSPIEFGWLEYPACDEEE